MATQVGKQSQLSQEDNQLNPNYGKPQTYPFEDYTIEVREVALHPLASEIAERQKSIISKGMIKTVEDVTRVQTVGWLETEPPAACAIVNVPANQEQNFMDLESMVLSWVLHNNKKVAATMIVSAESYSKLAKDPEYETRPEVDSSYTLVLACLNYVQPEFISSKMRFESPRSELTQADHNVLYVISFLRPSGWERAYQQLQNIDKETNVNRTIPTIMELKEAVLTVAARWSLVTTALPNEDLPNEDLPNEDLPNEDLPNEDLPNEDLAKDGLPALEIPLFELISYSSKDARDQRALIQLTRDL